MDEGTVTLRPELPRLPSRMRRRKLDDRGYPVPWFVPWLGNDDQEVADGEGRPEFRLMSERKLIEALKYHRCWLCGEELGKYRAFVIGPMCLVNRINSEPPSHLECAKFACIACPFLTRPHARRRENNMPEDATDAAGVLLKRNPGVTCLYVVDRDYNLRGDGAGKVLIELPDPHEVGFFAEGREAIPDEIRQAIESGVPALIEVCADADEEREVRDRVARVVATYVAA